MSITTANGHALKRRKLSHSGENGQGTSQSTIHDEKSTSEMSGAQSKSPRPSKGGENFTSRSKRSSGLATTGVTKSSLMQLQVNELLEETKPDYEAYLRDLKPITDKVVQVIKALPERAPLSFLEAEKTLRKKSGVSIPFARHRPNSDIKYQFDYKQPGRVTLRGGLVQHVGTRTDMTLEIAVQMPAMLFQEKDYLNHRAFHKRAYYTACLAAGIKEAFHKDFSCHYEFQDGNELVPVITLRSSQANTVTVMTNVKLVITATFPKNVGPIEKMSPGRNNIRGQASGQADVSDPTPFYNSTVRLLASTVEVDELIEDVIKRCDSFSDACTLGQTWLRQRGFASEISEGGFGLFEWTYMCALLLVSGGHKGQPLFSDRYSSVQLFKAMLQVLANRDLTDPLSVRASNIHLERSDLPTLYDGVNGINVLSRVSRWSYDLLRQEAQLSLAAINSQALDGFEPSFITKVAEPSLQFDEIYTVDMAASVVSKPKDGQELANLLYRVLKKGLGDRVNMLDLAWSSRTQWELNSAEPKQFKSQHILTVRLLCNPEAASRLIDHGPTAEEQDAAREFREFWGEKSELRRFRDGSITETLMWSPGSPVTFQIIQYLAAYHFKVAPSSIESRTPDLEGQCLSSSAPVSAEDAFKLVNTKYQELASMLHQMEGLPLPIRSVSPTGQGLRSACAGHPLDSATTTPIDILVQFDSSTRWPDHLLAIQHTKIAFLARISDLIKAADSSLTTRTGLENADSASTGYYNTTFLDIISPSPAPGLTSIVFRLRIHHERELQLLQGLVADKSLPNPTRDAVTLALTQHKRLFVSSPTHTAAIRNLITQFPPLSTTIRLLKFWIASHNLSNHVPDPIIEIIAAHVFLQPYPWSTPGNATTAFLRCLHCLSNWDWITTPLIVDLSPSQDMPSAQTTELETRFQAWKKLDPNMNTVAWFVGTSVDNAGTIWTQGPQPSKVVASRVTALARAAIVLVKSKATDVVEGDWANLFVSPLGDFDFVIHLKPSIVRGGKKRGKKNGEVKFKNLQVQEDLDVDSIGHDVVSLYLADLERAFASSVLFFYGEGGGHIAGLWRPSVNGRKEWRVRMGYSSVPFATQSDDDDGSTKGLAEINKDGILAEMALLGEGMIDKIHVKT